MPPRVSLRLRSIQITSNLQSTILQNNRIDDFAALHTSSKQNIIRAGTDQ
jgi:hypothetical protein